MIFCLNFLFQFWQTLLIKKIITIYFIDFVVDSNLTNHNISLYTCGTYYSEVSPCYFEPIYIEFWIQN